jgi:Ras-related protein Rab-11A
MSQDDVVIEEVKSSEVKEDYKLKVVVVGDSGVGKTNLIKRFITNTFSENSKATVGVEFISKSYKINNQVFKIEMWDTAGQERYKSITAAYYKGAKGALIVYDTTQKTSFENIDKWMVEIKDKASKDMKLMIVGNKTDLKDSRQVDTNEALQKAKDLEASLMETSAKDGSNVKEAFYDLLKEMYREIKKKIEIVENEAKGGKDGIQLETNEKPEKKGCC